jgi:serine/threonine-protein kinase
MGTVHLARAHGPYGFQRWFAIKRIHSHLAADPVFRAMFLDEARISASFHHPSIAQVFELGEIEGELFIALEYLHGEALSAWLEIRLSQGNGPLAPGLAAYLGARIAEGLHHAHEAKDDKGAPLGIVHRDVSPQNIFVTLDGEVKITDFGVARARDRMVSTGHGHWRGKLAYAAPEQLEREDELDRRVDVFALGVVLWEMTTGERLFRAENDLATMRRIADGYRVHPSSVIDGYPAELESMVMRALAHDRDQRYATMRELAEELDAFARTNGGHAARLREEAHAAIADRLAARASLLTGSLGEATARRPSPRAQEPTPIPSEPSRSEYLKAPSTWRRVLRVFAFAIGAVAALVGGIAIVDSTGSFERVASGPQVTTGSRSNVEAPAPSVAPPAPGSIPIATHDAPQVAEPTPDTTPMPDARLTLITRPWAHVWINGRRAGETPFVARPVRAGRIHVRLEPEGSGEPRTIVLEASPGEHVQRNLDL